MSHLSRLPPVPTRWVQDLWLKIGTRYGNAWARMWEGMEVELVQREWDEVLNPYRSVPGAFQFAIDHMPRDWPPTLLQFAALCARAPRPEAPRLEAPKADPATIRKYRGKLASLKFGTAMGPDWALKMHARIKSGDLKPTQLQRESLRYTIVKLKLPLDMDF